MLSLDKTSYCQFSTIARVRRARTGKYKNLRDSCFRVNPDVDLKRHVIITRDHQSVDSRRIGNSEEQWCSGWKGFALGLVFSAL